MDYVPRDENGTPIDSKTAGVMHLYKVVSYTCSLYVYHAKYVVMYCKILIITNCKFISKFAITLRPCQINVLFY